RSNEPPLPGRSSPHTTSSRDPSLLAEALTHSPIPSTPRTAPRIVGDAALCLALTNYLYLTNPDLGPGPLSLIRAANISTEKLARVAVRHGLYRLLRRNSPKLDEMVEEFTRIVEREGEGEMYGQPYGGSTIKAPKVLADIVESIAAAVYVDCNLNLEKMWMVFRGLLEPIITAENLDEQPVTTLYEYCQKKGKALNFKNWKKGNVNVTNVFVDGELIGIGYSEHQNIAKLNAARDAIQKLGDLKGEHVDMDIGGEESNTAKHKLNEMCSKKHWPKPVYRMEGEEGPPHDKKFACSVQVRISNKEYFEVGDLKSRIRDSENSAAAKVLAEIRKG
ncbi:ribonuclease 3-like protein 2, partial [Asparagus officinalis]|uniref:ribonuclease 3-like protein 2 n=1 Tax=Asparagus officinalis TaxID=4686 RepID=UPI00098DFD53